MCETGTSLTLEFNMDTKKTPMPSRTQVMLGCLHNSTTKRVRTSTEKVTKYCQRIDACLSSSRIRVRDLESLHGNLNYAAAVAPFARPFLAPLTESLTKRRRNETVRITDTLRSALRIWKKVLIDNQGLSFDFILGKLPRTNDIFTDASTEWGVGGCCGTYYFLFSWNQLDSFHVDIIARMELLAVLISVACFRNLLAGHYARIFCDNSNVVS